MARVWHAGVHRTALRSAQKAKNREIGSLCSRREDHKLTGYVYISCGDLRPLRCSPRVGPSLLPPPSPPHVFLVKNKGQTSNKEQKAEIGRGGGGEKRKKKGGKKGMKKKNKKKKNNNNTLCLSITLGNKDYVFPFVSTELEPIHGTAGSDHILAHAKAAAATDFQTTKERRRDLFTNTAGVPCKLSATCIRSHPLHCRRTSAPGRHCQAC